MKKLGVILAVVVAALVLGLPAVLGMLTESQVNARVAALAGNPFVGAEVRSFERGWFFSTTKIELKLSQDYIAQLQALDALSGDPATSTAALARGVTIVADLAHGPVAVLDGVHFGLSKMVARLDPATEGYAELLQRFGIEYLFEFGGRTSFFGAVHFDADAPPIDFAAEDGRVSFSGAVLDGSFAGRSLRYDGRIESFEFTSGTGAFSLQGISATGDNELGLPYVALGTVDLAIQHASMLDGAVATEPVFDAVNLRFSSQVDLDDSGTLANGVATYTADSIVAGPDMRIRDVTLGMTFRNLDVDALQAYAQAVRRSTLVGLVEPGQMLADVTPAVERLLAAAPSVQIDPIRFTFNNEVFDARLQLDTKTDRLPAAGALDLRDPLLWFSLLDASLAADVSKNLARSLAIQATLMTQLGADPTVPPDQVRYLAEAQAGLILVTLVAQGILTDAGENYSTELVFTNGALTINGKPLPFGVP